MRMDKNLGLVIKELSATDVNFAQVVAQGEWTPLLTKKDMAVLIDNRNARTLIIQRTIDKRVKKDFTVKNYEVSITWYIIGRKITKTEASEIYENYKKRKPKFLTPIRKTTIDRRPFREIELVRRQIENINYIMKHGVNLTHGDRVRLGKRRAKLRKKLEELRI